MYVDLEKIYSKMPYGAFRRHSEHVFLFIWHIFCGLVFGRFCTPFNAWFFSLVFNLPAASVHLVAKRALFERQTHMCSQAFD